MRIIGLMAAMVFLLVFSAGFGQGKPPKKPKGGETTIFDAEATAGICSAPLLIGDTTKEDCGEGIVKVKLNQTNDAYINFDTCIEPFILPGLDRVVGGPDDITIIPAWINGKRDRNMGDIFALEIHFADLNHVGYKTDLLSINPPEIIDSVGATIYVQADNVEVKGENRGKKLVGEVCIGVIDIF